MSRSPASTPNALPGDPAPAAEARVAASVDAWKRSLLDLTTRNRALNFRPTRVSTVAIVDERPAEIFRQLVLREQALRFLKYREGVLPPRLPIGEQARTPIGDERVAGEHGDRDQHAEDGPSRVGKSSHSAPPPATAG